jgi:2-methylisocitrate lyase-like PEP mutase family enzyme
MRTYCSAVDGPKLANMLEFGLTPILPPGILQDMGYTVAAYPLTLLSASARAMQRSLGLLKHGKVTDQENMSFEDLKHTIGFTDYNQIMKRYQ